MVEMIRHCFTGADNRTVDIGRVLWALGVLSFIVFAAIHVIHNHAFDPASYGGGLGGLLAGGGAGVGFKWRSEPSQ